MIALRKKPDEVVTRIPGLGPGFGDPACLLRLDRGPPRLHLLRLLAEAEGPHVGPDSFDVFEAFRLETALSGCLPTQRHVPVGQSNADAPAPAKGKQKRRSAGSETGRWPPNHCHECLESLIRMIHGSILAPCRCPRPSLARSIPRDRISFLYKRDVRVRFWSVRRRFRNYVYGGKGRHHCL